MDTLKERLAAEVCAPLDAEGYTLVDISIGHGRNVSTVRLFVDKEGGITVGDCAFVSNLVSGVLDRGNFLGGSYRLEVSSPGLDRPLKTARDFERHLGKTVAVAYTESGAHKWAIGEVVHAGQDRIVLETDAGSLVVPLASIAHAKIKLKW